jgi:hypothetical protein
VRFHCLIVTVLIHFSILQYSLIPYTILLSHFSFDTVISHFSLQNVLSHSLYYSAQSFLVYYIAQSFLIATARGAGDGSIGEAHRWEAARGSIAHVRLDRLGVWG